MLALSNDDLIGLVPITDLIALMEAAVWATADKRVLVPPRTHIDWQGNSMLAMPAAAEEYFGIKLVTVVPNNVERGLPATNGLMILNDGQTGMPLAVMNAGALTAQRTGAVGSLGVKYMTPPGISSIGAVGCGVQGAWQVIFASSIRPIHDVFCVDPNPANITRFAKTINRHAPQLRIIACRDAREVLERTDLVIAATTSSQPVLPNEATLLEGKHFISVGSFRPTMQELPDSVYRLAGSLVVDCEHAREEVGDVMNPLRLGILTESDIHSIAEYTAGRRIADTTRTTVYKTVGMAAYDLYAAQAFYLAAKSREVGQEVRL